MECNKEEAVRAKKIADKMLVEMDLAGANKFALKAQNMYPGLDGVSELLASLHVYNSAENKVNGEVDWYGVIGAEPSADDDKLRRCYKQMALSVHPDKNNSVGADGAFKILSQAWSVLSCKNKKVAYDQKRNLNGMYTKSAGVGSAREPESSHSQATGVVPPSHEQLKRRHKEAQTAAMGEEAVHKRTSTNKTGTGVAAGSSNSNLKEDKTSNFQSDTNSKSAGVQNVRAPTFSAKQDNDVHPSTEQQKRRHEGTRAAAMGEETLQKKTNYASKKTGTGVSTGSSKFNVKEDDKSTIQSGTCSKSAGVGSVRTPTFPASKATSVVHPSRTREQPERRYPVAQTKEASKTYAHETGTGLAGSCLKSTLKECKKSTLKSSTYSKSGGNVREPTFSASQATGVVHEQLKEARKTCAYETGTGLAYSSRKSTLKVDKKSNFKSCTYSKLAGNGSMGASTFSASQAIGATRQSREQPKRKHEEAQAATMRQEAIKRKTLGPKRAGTGLAAGSSKSAEDKKSTFPSAKFSKSSGVGTGRAPTLSASHSTGRV